MARARTPSEPIRDADTPSAASRLYAELLDLSQAMSRARAEIAAPQADEIGAHHLPSTADALEAVSTASEEASSGVLGAVRRIETLTHEMAPEIASAVKGEVIALQQACDLQDGANQRVRKLVRTLQHVELMLERVRVAFGAEMETAPPSGARPVSKPSHSSRPSHLAKRPAQIAGRLGTMD